MYTLRTAQKMGVAKAAKALTSKNTCKACGLGMGGQLGGMRNELGEFPSVCNKSVQAQSTDTQPPIPDEIFEHPIVELKELDSLEFDRLGRLGSPLHKAATSDRYRKISWDEAMAIAAERLSAMDPNRTFFYSSGRSSNEAGFLFQLLARVYGTNNVSNCSYYCHQATSVALGNTIGTGTSTVELGDLKECDLIFVIGANPSSNHPRFIHLLKACRDRGGEVVIINPAREPGLVKFAVPKSPSSLISGGSEIASLYVQPRVGEDIALFKGVAKALVEAGLEDAGFIERWTEGYDDFLNDLHSTPWEEIETRSGVAKKLIEQVARLYGNSESAVFAWGMGMTHHLHGVRNIEYISNLALMRGMVGRRGAGLLPLRGHSNVQGIGTIGVKPVLPDEVIQRMEDAFSVALPKDKGLDTMGSMRAAEMGAMDGAVIMGGNLFSANPHAEWAERALSRIKFRLHLTTTLNQTHVYGLDDAESLVLPVTARDEEWEPTTQESMFNYVRLSDGGINRLADVRPESVILADLGTALAPDSPIDFQAFKRHREVRKAISEIVPGMEALRTIDVAKKEFTVRNRTMHAPSFRTPTQKAQFRVHALPPKGDAPFQMTTIRSEGQFNSIVYEYKDAYRGVETRWSVLMNRKDMNALNISDGDRVTLKSAQGVMDAVNAYAFDIPSGCVMTYYPEANVLTSIETDSQCKTPAFKSTGVWIEAAGGSAAVFSRRARRPAKLI
ncbi:MAG: FdhF/YdeP family oxidoreductase [Pseudomonadota bacterium]